SRLGGFFVSIVRKKYISKLQSTINNTLHAQSSILVVFPLDSRWIQRYSHGVKLILVGQSLDRRCFSVGFSLDG
ncbi:hypothetical protein, partial [Vibrio sp. 708]